MGVVKVNVDGSFWEESSLMGLGGLIRSPRASWITGFACFEGCGDCLLAVKRELVLA